MTRKSAEAIPNSTLRTIRKEHGWTQQEVADRIGAPLALNVTRWECGTAKPSAHYVERLCQLFHRSASELGLMAHEHTHELRPSEHPLWHVPLRRNPFFTGRDELLEHVHTQLNSHHPSTITSSYALRGLGGIGKTQVALEYVYRFQQSYRAVFWICAGSRESLVSDIVAIAHLLGLPEDDEHDQRQIVAEVKHWLEHNQGWLLILDNVDDLEVVQEVFPTKWEGRILLTTRIQATGMLAHGISVEKMDVQEGCLLVLRRAGLLSSAVPLLQVESILLQETQALVQVLDGLPLALDQAGAYIEETGCSLLQYLQLYHRCQRTLLNRRSMYPSIYPHSVFSTWALSFRRIEQVNPVAADMLRLYAFLDPDAIPTTLLINSTIDLGSRLSEVVVDPMCLNEALGVLRCFSLVTRSPREPMLSMHRLVQVVLRESLSAEEQRCWAERAVRVINAVFPGGALAHWPTCQSCLPHVQVCVVWITRYQFTFPEAAQLLDSVGTYLSKQGSYSQTEQLLQLSLSIREQTAGSEHPETATSLAHLASHLDRLFKIVLFANLSPFPDS